jgi:hyperosmotically inducible protein
MTTQKSRKLIVASSMAVVVGIVAVIFVLSTRHDTPVAQAALHPPTRIAEVPAAPATTSSPADDQNVGTSTQLAASDGQITTDVKSQLAGDSLSKGVNIGVTTTHGVVALTGTLASQNAIDHVKDVAGKVKDVKSVDTSALVLARL